MEQDFFRPKRNPAQLIYDTFQKEAENRKKCSVEEWIKNERKAVFEAAKKYAEENGLIVPTLEQIEVVENYAMGSVDYGAKWAYKVCHIMEGIK